MFQRKQIIALCLGFALSAGCAQNGGVPTETAAVPPSFDSRSPAASPTNSASGAPSAGGMDDVIARVNGQPVTMRQLVGPLVEAHGLNLLLNLVQLELVKQDAAAAHIVVTSQDVEEERRVTMDKLFKGSDDPKLTEALDKSTAARDKAKAAGNVAETQKEMRQIAFLNGQIASDRDAFLTQFLDNQHIDRTEFDIVLKINTYLRKIAEPQLRGKINDEALQRAFGQMYGERIVVRYMELANMQEVGDAKRRIDAGEKFADVAHDMSHNRESAEHGGMLPPFTRQTASVPQTFKDMAFSLKDGQVGDPLVLGQTYILIRREKLLPPQAVRFEDVRQYIYNTLSDKLTETVMKKLKQDLARQAAQQLKIDNPVLAGQYQQREALAKQDAAKKAQQDLDRAQRVREILGGGAATQPSTQPLTGSVPPSAESARPAGAAVPGEQPPARQPGPSSFELPKLTPDTAPSLSSESK